MSKIIELFQKGPCIIGIVSDPNQGKSNMLYHIITELAKKSKFTLYTYGLKTNVLESIRIYSVEELEEIRNSLVIIDEFENIFDLTDRKIKLQIERTLRLIFHNNNILVLSGLGNNFKKFISAKLDVIMYKKVRLAEMINGSRVKEGIKKYEGDEKGAAVLNLHKNEVLIYDGFHYSKEKVPYLKQFDSKRFNANIFTNKEKKK